MIAFSGRGILLDIEGTTSSISFVYEVLFPYVRRELEAFLSAHWGEPAVVAACEQIARDVGAESLAAFSQRAPLLAPRVLISEEVKRLMDADAKTIGLKQLQGLIWKQGYAHGELKSHVFSDVAPALARWAAHGISVRIYSSGSVEAQRAFFAHTEAGSLSHLLHGYYDTAIGPKRSSASYLRIAADMCQAPHDILFLSDTLAELDAAREAGLATGLVNRAANTRISNTAHPTITEFDQIVLP